MVDKVVEFINRSGLTYADLRAGVPLVAPAAGQQAVIKDLTLTGASRPLSLQVKGQEILAASAPGRYSGSEIIAENTSAVLKTSVTPAFSGLVMYDTSYRAWSTDHKTVFAHEASFPVASRLLNTGNAYASSMLPYFCCQTPSGDVYYSNLGRSNSSWTNLYRRLKGISGAESSITTGMTNACFDGSRYIYGLLSTGALVVVDTSNGTVTNIQLKDGVTGNAYSLPTSSIYCALTAIDGWVFIVGQSTLVLVETKSGMCASLDLLPYSIPPANNVAALGVAKNLSGEYVVVRGVSITDTSGQSVNQFAALNLGKSLSLSSTIKDVQRFDSGGIPSGHGNTNLIIPASGLDNGIMIACDMAAAAQFCVININTLSTTVLPKVTTIASSISSAFAVLDMAQAARDFGTIGVRATGVLSDY